MRMHKKRAAASPSVWSSLSDSTGVVIICPATMSDVMCYEENTPVGKIWEFFRRMRIRGVVIVKDESPVGFVNRDKILQLLYNPDTITIEDETSNESDNRTEVTCNSHGKTVRAGTGNL